MEIAVYLGNGARLADIYFGTLTVMGVGSNGFIFDVLEWPVIRVSRLQVEFLKTERFRDKVTKEHY